MDVSNLIKIVAVLILGLVVITGTLAPPGGLPKAQAACSAYKPDGSLNWSCGWPKVPKLSVPRFNFGGPRPPLTPKNDVWCRSGYVAATSSAGWRLWNTTKYDIQFWPDYAHRTFRGIILDRKLQRWFYVNEWTGVDCDL